MHASGFIMSVLLTAVYLAIFASWCHFYAVMRSRPLQWTCVIAYFASGLAIFSFLLGMAGKWSPSSLLYITSWCVGGIALSDLFILSNWKSYTHTDDWICTVLLGVLLMLVIGNLIEFA